MDRYWTLKEVIWWLIGDTLWCRVLGLENCSIKGDKTIWFFVESGFAFPCFRFILNMNLKLDVRTLRSGSKWTVRKCTYPKWIPGVGATFRWRFAFGCRIFVVFHENIHSTTHAHWMLICISHHILILICQFCWNIWEIGIEKIFSIRFPNLEFIRMARSVVLISWFTDDAGRFWSPEVIDVLKSENKL